MQSGIANPQTGAPEWMRDAIFYQIFPDRFCNGEPKNDPPGTRPWGDLPTRENFFGGDLQGILNRLDHIQDLGANALYLNPIFRAATNHKYDTWDYFQIDPAFGSIETLKQLVKACHQRGMRVILDGVFNHCGEGFFAFADVRRLGPRSPYRDWFFVRSFPLQREPPSYITCGGAVYLPKLNMHNREVQEYILNVARFWLEEAGIDGWRLDVPFKIPLEFWQEFRNTVKGVNPDAYLVGEVWREAGIWVRGDIFDGVTNYRLRELILDYCGSQILDGEDFAFETDLLNTAHGYAQGNMLNLLGSHDTARILTLLRGDQSRLRIALTYILTNPGAPLIYYGDEVGLFGETDPDCRRTFPWDRGAWNNEVYRLYRNLIQLRLTHPALRRGKRKTLFTLDGVCAFRHVHEDDEVIVIYNPRNGVADISVPVLHENNRWRELFSGIVVDPVGDSLHLSYLPASTALVFFPE